MVDYRDIFNSQLEKLFNEGYHPDKATSDEYVSKVESELKERMLQLEAAIEELRIRHQATSHVRDENKKRASQKMQDAIAESDMNYRQKKQAEKIDKGIEMKELQKANLVKALTALGKTSDEIREILAKKGL